MLHLLALLIMEAAVIFVYYRQPGVGVHAPLTLLWLEMRRLVNIKVSCAKKMPRGKNLLTGLSVNKLARMTSLPG